MAERSIALDCKSSALVATQVRILPDAHAPRTAEVTVRGYYGDVRFRRRTLNRRPSSMAEQSLCKRKVLGSSPGGGSII